MSHYRLNLFIQPEHAQRLDELAAKKGVSKSSIVAAALASWLSPDAADQREAAIAKRLDRLSRQETARPLLTPGEVMQLPPDESVVMVGSSPPIKAKKLRYYADSNFKWRVLPSPTLTDGQYADAPQLRPDDWSGMAIPAVPAALAADTAEGFGAATDDGGPRRQPELSETVAYDPELAAPAADLGLLDDDDDLPLPLPRQLDPAMQRTARLASLDPNDGIDL